MINEIIQQVREGLKNPLEAYIQLKKIESELKIALPLINEEAIEEAKKFGEKTFKFKGAKISLKSNAGRWDYSHIAGWAIQKDKLKDIEEAAKTAYKTKGKSVAFDMNGEEIEPAKYTPGSDNIAVEILAESENPDPLNEVFNG
jgi:hypothetical protein